jgi:pyruvate-formate lyase
MLTATCCRLSDQTHALASRALGGEWGRNLVDAPINLNSADLAGLSDEMIYARGIRAIAEQAPLRIVPGERIVGSATLEQATHHQAPFYVDGQIRFGSASHTSLGFDIGLRGLCALREQIDERICRGDLDAKGADLLQAMLICLDAQRTWHRRHMAKLDELIAASSGDERAHYERVARNLRDIPERAPRNFYEAAQSLWFLFAFQRLCGNWSGIGRIDKLLGPYLQCDLDSSAITLDEAREILAHFWIKGCDWIGAPAAQGGSGDAQYYQNVVLAGIDEEGNDVTNAVTYLVLDVVEELRISEFPIAVRINADSPARLLDRIAGVQRLGGGIVAIYNERQIIQSLLDFGYPLHEARDFANDGCWEIIIPGRTSFSYYPYDLLALLQNVLGVTRPDDPPADYADFEDLYAAFRNKLAEKTAEVQRSLDGAINGYPNTLFSLFVHDCIENGRGYFDGGPRYTVRAPHAGGIPDTGNSLCVIRRLVYEEGRLTLPEFVEILRADWQGHETLRQHVVNGIDFYGNDAPAADAMARRVFDDFLAEVAKTRERNGVLRPPGVSTFGREIEWRPQRGACATGRRRGDILALNFSPSPGTDRHGPTSVIKSHCAMGLSRLTNGTALELKLHPSSIAGPAGRDALAALMRAFVSLGGIFMHIDVVDDAMLRDAQLHPEAYQGLAVRVSGWSARFVTLGRDWQEMVINRTTQEQ